MFISFLSHCLCAWFAFALPCYATFKALAHPHAPDALHTLAMYWAVLAFFMAFEQSLGLLLSWLPFYWELRTICLLYISLPQTQGSTFVYKSFLEPWCSNNEADIDAAIVSARSNALTFCRSRISALVDLVSACLNNSAQSPDSESAHPLAVPVDYLKRIWDAYTAFAPEDASDVHVHSTADHVHQP